EVQPLVVAGHLTGGPHDGLPFATKGGLIGGHDAILAAVAQLHAMPGPATGPGRPETPGRGDEDERTTTARTDAG
ncbi:MAG: hypothetical protein GEV04_25335, partial [Actinophytocola sp.]|nr:hypothetical protein [Actinophytocola sp.]